MGLSDPNMRPDMEWAQHPNTRALIDELDTLRTALMLASREAAQWRTERDALAERVKEMEAFAAEASEEHGLTEQRLTRAERERNEARAALRSLAAFARSFAETAEAAVRHAEGPRGGQQVPFFGDFGNAPPSAIARLRWWAREARAALESRHD